MSDFKLDDYHRHEACDRLHVAMCSFHDHIEEHPYIAMSPSLAKKAEEISALMMAMYQEIQ